MKLGRILKYLSAVRFWLVRQIHISWQITGVAAGLLAGVGLSLVPETAVFAHWSWLILAVACAVLAFARCKTWLIIFAIIAGLLVGMWRGTIERVELNDYGQFLGQNITLSGKVFEDPSVGLSGELKLRLVDVVVDGVDLPGQVWASVVGTRGAEVRRSDIVTIAGKLKSGFGTFPASMSYASLKSVETIAGSDPARDLRDAFGEELETAIDDPAKDLGMGILAGQKTALPIDISEAFRIAGLTHIVVASGYNLTILIRFARRLFAKVSRLAALIGGAASAFGFACVTGFSPSMSRAALVTGLSLLAWYYGRKFHPIVLLLIVAAITAIINPAYVWGDAGWYMSFMAFAGVIILAPLIRAYFWPNKITASSELARSRTWRERLGSVRQIFIETMSAQLMTAPIIALFMGNFSPYGLLANLLVLPIVPLTMLLTFIAGIVGWLIPPIAEIVGWPAQVMLDYIITVARFVSELPGASQEVTFGLPLFVAVILLIVATIVYLRYRTGHHLRNDNVVE
ncbi:hypothetical protein FACS189431_6250 [Alphaproteobacteria bacterium]|nr:hypothetical protein FACS189431_6250 [Alphaproteobacteria bacterium]